MRLAPFMKDGTTFNLHFEGKRDSVLIRVNCELGNVTGATWRARPDDDAEVLILDKPKMRTMYIPYYSIRYIEQSKLSEAEALFG